MFENVRAILTAPAPSEPVAAWESVAEAIALEEYKALRAEIQDRVKNEFVLITASATLTSAGVALWSQSSARSHTLLLSLPLLSFLLAFLHFAQENSIAAAAAYINKSVRPRLLALIPPGTIHRSDVLSWEEFRRQAIYQASSPIKALTAVGVSTPAVPGILITTTMTARLLSQEYREALQVIDVALLLANWLLILLFIVASVHNWRMYKSITSPD